MLLLSGSVHYPRVHPSRWNALFDTFRRARLNTLETYVFWNEHFVHDPSVPRERLFSSPSYDFEGRKDLFGFLSAAHDAGLYVILRIGPYVCAETSYGGFPFALREVPGIQFRTLNKHFQDAVAGWLRHLADHLHRRRLLSPAGGPVILVQLENEYQMVAGAYGNEGEEYLQWCSDLQHELNFGVPTIMCYGAAEGAVETVNSFYAHNEMESLQSARPDQPVVWTECWTGWYDVWGAPHHCRPTIDLAYAVARFFAQGGAGINYYMWMGGTNYGRFSMYLQATSYDYDAPVDEFYMETTKASHLTKLHDVLLDYHAPLMLGEYSADIGTTKKPVLLQLSAAVVVYKWSETLAYICNDSDDAQHDVRMPQSSFTLESMPPKSVVIVNEEEKRILYNSVDVSQQSRVSRNIQPAELDTGKLTWLSRAEPVGLDAFMPCQCQSADRASQTSPLPPEQLLLTQDNSDYCWYTATFNLLGSVSEMTMTQIRKEGVVLRFEACDYVHLYINGRYSGHTAEPLWEDRKCNKWNQYSKPQGFHHAIHVDGHTASAVLSQNVKEDISITLLVCALGLVKSDWQLGCGKEANMLHEKKGLISDVEIHLGRSEGELIASRSSSWTAVAGLVGESLRWPRGITSRCACEASKISRAAQSRNQEVEVDGPVWYEATVKLQERCDSLVIDLGTMGKGLLWANGTLLGRYWSIAGTRGRNGFLDGSPIQQAPHGTLTQRYYHIPMFVLNDSPDDSLRITLFEERGKRVNLDGVNLFVVR